MLTEPRDLAAATVLQVVREHWDPDVVSSAFVPVGAGAFHWVCAGRRMPRWFVTADDVTTPGRLEELLDTYAAARELATRGHHVVVPTVPPLVSAPADDTEEAPVGVVVGSYLVTVTAYLEGASGPGEYADDNQRTLVAGALGDLHSDTPPRRVRTWAPGPPLRTELLRLLATLDRPWRSGPMGESARTALRDNVAEVHRLYGRHDALATRAESGRAGWVPTHGEPHTANVLWRAAGPVLVDWESLRLAPRERDLRTVLRGAAGAEPLSAYVAHGGSGVLDDDMVELFDLEWWLWDVADFAVRFSRPHTGDADDARFHAALLAELDPAGTG